LLAQSTPVPSNTKINKERTVYNVFDKRTTTLLYEYYLLLIFTEYINLTKDPVMASQMLKPPNKEDVSLYSSDFLVEQQLRMSEEDIYMEGNVDKLQEDTAKLLVTYITFMLQSKKTIDLSYDKIDDLIFKLKEAEKYTFTDRLRDLDDEQREVENVLKIYNSFYRLYFFIKRLRSVIPNSEPLICAFGSLISVPTLSIAIIMTNSYSSHILFWFNIRQNLLNTLSIYIKYKECERGEEYVNNLY
jgi:hypothetical protein